MEKDLSDETSFKPTPSTTNAILYMLDEGYTLSAKEPTNQTNNNKRKQSQNKPKNERKR